jgi:hypothetical protein
VRKQLQAANFGSLFFLWMRVVIKRSKMQEMPLSCRNFGYTKIYREYCILSLLVTTSDLTAPAKKEAEKFNVDFWHGGLLTQKLITWGKWRPSKKNFKGNRSKESEPTSSRSQLAALTTPVCICGSSMVERKGKEGKLFFGCSKFPTCRHTKAI